MEEVCSSKREAAFTSSPPTEFVIYDNSKTFDRGNRSLWDLFFRGLSESCPQLRGMPENNLMVASSILFTSSSYTEIFDWATTESPNSKEDRQLVEGYLIRRSNRRFLLFSVLR